MGELRASHHNFHQLRGELCVVYAGPWTARVISGNAISEALARSSRGPRDEAPPISGDGRHCGNDVGN